MVTRIGKYEIRAELGRGGFGRVYEAFDPQLRLAVAIKVLSAEGDPEMLARFIEEARLTANLNHNNIVRVFGYGEQDGNPYLVMELLEGKNLAQIIEKPLPLSVLQKVQIMSQVAEGLHYAHQKGIVHRDVKPGNIMLAPDGTARIMDFGIARMTGQDTRKTRQGDLVGTILYMAPEQFRNVDAGPLTDIFSYGVTFYELLTGRHPFHATDPATALYQISSVDPVRIREIVPECPQALENILHRSLIKDRDLRYQSLNEVFFDLQPILLELRQEKASKVLEGVAPLIEAKRWAEADALIRLALDSDPANREARQLRATVQNKIQEDLLRKKVDEKVKQAEQLISEERFREATDLYTSACHLLPNDEDLRSRREKAQARLDARQRASRMLAEARDAARRDDLTCALKKVREALDADPGYQDAQALEKELRQQTNDRKVSSILERAQRLRSHGDYEEALALLSAEECESLNSSEIAECRGRLEGEWKAEVQRRDFESNLQSAEQLLDRQDLTAAEHRLQDLRDRFPELALSSRRLAGLRDRLEEKRKIQRVEAIRQNAAKLYEAGQFSTAREGLQQSLEKFPEEASLKSLLDKVSDAELRERRRQTTDEVLARVHSLQNKGDLKKALDTLLSLGNEALQNADLKKWHQQLELDLASQVHAAGLRKAIEEGLRLLDLGQSEKALAVLTEHSSRYPEEPRLRDLLSEAQRRVDLAEEERVVDQTISRTAELEGASQWRVALDEAKKAAQKYPQNPALERLVARLKKASDAQERLETVSALYRQIEEAIQQQNWTGAELALESAHNMFRDEPQFDILTERLRQARRKSDLEGLSRQVDLDLAADDVKSAATRLEETREQFGQETIWQVSHRELERRRRYLGSLGDARKRHAAKDFAGAEQVLSGVLPIAPDPRAASLLKVVIADREESEKREAASRREEESIRQILDHVTRLEQGGRYQSALEEADAGLNRHPAREELSAAVERLRKLLSARQRDDRLAVYQEVIEEAVDQKRWSQAFETLQTAEKDFPDDRSLNALAEKIRQGRLQLEFTNLAKSVSDHLARDETDAAAAKLAGARGAFASEPRLEALERSLERRCRYLATLAEADARRRDRNYRAAEQLLRASLPEALDERAATLLETIVTEREEAERNKAAFEEEERVIANILANVVSLENGGRRKAALEEVESALQRYPGHADLQAAAERLRKAILGQQRLDKIAAYAFEIDQAIAAQNWSDASSSIGRARKEFPAEKAIAVLSEKLTHEQYLADLADVVNQIRSALAENHLEDAARCLKENRKKFSREPVWQTLERELDRRKQYDASLERAEVVFRKKNYDKAEELLQSILAAEPIDQRAAALLNAVRTERLRVKRADQIKRVCQKATQHGDAGDFEGAVAYLEASRQLYPDENELAVLLTTFKQKLKQQQVEAAQKAADAAKALPGVERLPHLPASSVPPKKLRRYLATLAEAEVLRRNRNFPAAEQLLRAALPEAIDERAEALLTTIVTEREEAERKKAAIDEEERVIANILDSVASLEKEGRRKAALEEVESALQRYPRAADLKAAAERLRIAILDQQRVDKINAYSYEIGEAIAARNWSDATSSIKRAREEFPNERALGALSDKLDRERYLADLADLVNQIRPALAEDRLEDAARSLREHRKRFSREPVWQTLERELERRRQYEGSIEKAEVLFRKKSYDKAEELLQSTLAAEPIDQRAATLLNAVRTEHMRVKRAEQVKRACLEANRHADAEDFQGAVTYLQTACQLYPDENELTILLTTFEQKLDRQQAEAAQRVAEAAKALPAVESLPELPAIPLPPKIKGPLYWKSGPVLGAAVVVLGASIAAIVLWPHPPKKPDREVQKQPALVKPAPIVVQPKPKPQQDSLGFACNEKSSEAAWQALRWDNAGMPFTVLPDHNWLTVTPPKGPHLDQLKVSVDCRQLSAGTQSAILIVQMETSHGASEVKVPVTLKVSSKPVPFGIEPPELTFEYQSGVLTPQPSQTITVTGESGRVDIDPRDVKWVQFKTAPGKITVTVNPRDLPSTASSQHATLMVYPADQKTQQPKSVNVALIVKPPVQSSPPPKCNPPKTYFGRFKGTAVWQRTLQPNQRIDLKTAEIGDLPPGEPLTGTVNQKTISVDWPTLENGCRLSVTNFGETPVDRISIRWQTTR